MTFFLPMESSQLSMIRDVKLAESAVSGIFLKSCWPSSLLCMARALPKALCATEVRHNSLEAIPCGCKWLLPNTRAGQVPLAACLSLSLRAGFAPHIFSASRRGGSVWAHHLTKRCQTVVCRPNPSLRAHHLRTAFRRQPAQQIGVVVRVLEAHSFRKAPGIRWS